MLEINIISIFPNLFEEFKKVLPLNRAIEKNLVKLNLINLRDFAINTRGDVDDRPYGGASGMILRIEPLVGALESIPTKLENVIVLNPKGKTFDQRLAQEFSKLQSLTFVCGRYEGIDQRFIENYATHEISIGNFVCSGGEAPTICIIESIVRLLPGILDEEASQKESFSDDTLEHPQYTRPNDFRGLKVPGILLSGNHQQIEKWKKEHERKVN